MSTDWTPAEVARLCDLWSQGLSISGIGREMGRAKDSIAGKAFRLNLPPRPREARGKRTIVVTARGVAALAASPAVPVLPPVQECQWIEERGRICGEPVLSRKPYCGAHCERAYLRKEMTA